MKKLLAILILGLGIVLNTPLQAVFSWCKNTKYVDEVNQIQVGAPTKKGPKKKRPVKQGNVSYKYAITNMEEEFKDLSLDDQKYSMLIGSAEDDCGKVMEDKFCINEVNDTTIIVLADGHGAEVSGRSFRMPGMRGRKPQKKLSSQGSTVARYVCQRLSTEFAELILRGKNISPPIAESIFYQVDKEILSEDDYRMSGATATVIIISPDVIKVFYCGDSRVIFKMQDDNVIGSRDHSPNDEIEEERIKKAGYSVYGGRVGGMLGVARSLGDRKTKAYKKISFSNDEMSKEDLESMFKTYEKYKDKFCVVAKPDFMQVPTSEVEFLFVASDGIWDVWKNNEVADFLSKSIPATFFPQDLDNAVQAIIKRSIPRRIEKKISKDNMSGVFAYFS